ncbi:hypothetical protein K501DRAFT_166692 [Backusella circina FSU 941]|nr:hypothetical protein K501DRAFT_166692 [Backusella circina FSU 941]
MGFRRGPRVQWVYANGSSWVSLDPRAQAQLEQLWSINSSYWIQSDNFNFKGPLYADIGQMCIVYNGMTYTIARRRF